MHDSIIDKLKMTLTLQCYANGLDPVQEGILVEGEDFDSTEELMELKKEGEKLKVITDVARKIIAKNKKKMINALYEAGINDESAMTIITHMDCNVLNLSGNE